PPGSPAAVPVAGDFVILKLDLVADWRSDSPCANRRWRGSVRPGNAGCSVIWLARLHGVQKVAGSNPVTPTESKIEPNQDLDTCRRAAVRRFPRQEKR